MSYRRDRKWADDFVPAMQHILAEHAGKFVAWKLVEASVEDDTKKCTDYLFAADDVQIAARLRRPEYLRYQDVTIRAHRDSGATTELAKLREGLGKFYLYGWTDDWGIDLGQIAKWVLYDLDIVRSAGLLEKNWSQKDNRDGTYFIAIPVAVLRDVGAVVAESK